MDGPVWGWLVCLVCTVNMHTSQPPLMFPNICACNEGQERTRDGHLLCCEKLWLSKFGCMNQNRVPAGQKGFEKQNSVGQREQQKQRQIRAGQQTAFTLSFNQATYNAEPEVGLKSNGLNKHYYLYRSPPPQFTRGQML